MLSLLHLLALALPAGGAPPTAVVVTAPAPDKELDAAAAKLRRAVGAGSEADKKKALNELIALEDAGAAAILEAEYSRTSQDLRTYRDRIIRNTYVLGRKEELLALMELRAEHDGSLTDSVSRLRNEIRDLRAALDKDRRKERSRAKWRDQLGTATADLFGRLGTGSRRKAEGTIWTDAEEHAELGVRIGAVEMLGHIGGPGTALRLYELVADAHSDRQSIKKGLRKLEKEVHEFEGRLQEEAERQGGGMSRATQEQYNRLKADATSARRELTRLAFLLDAATEAAGRALDREEGKILDKAIATMLRHRKKAKGGLGLLILDVFRHSEDPGVAAVLRGLLAETKEPLVRAEIIDALASHGDRTIEEELIAVHLADESWHVRSRAVAALATLRSKDGIPALIERLEAEEGRVRTDIATALKSLTGKPFGTNVDTWRRFWKAEGAGFQVPEEEAELEGSLDVEETLGVTFFGIKTESQRVLFVFDVSGSMNFSMVPRSNPTDDMSRPPDMPREGEDSRLEVAKRELVKAFGGIRDGGLFNIVLYASDVWSWEDELVEMETETRSDALRYAESLGAVGGTNIYGALARAFDMAGVKEGDEWSAPLVDTMFILSDGRASVGVTTNAREILTYVEERNRAAGIVIHTIGLSGAQDAFLLRSLAEQNGGIYAAR